MPVTLPGKNDSKRGHLEKSTDRHKKRQVVKSRGNPLHHQGAVRRQPRGGVCISVQTVLHPSARITLLLRSVLRGSCAAAF